MRRCTKERQEAGEVVGRASLPAALHVHSLSFLPLRELVPLGRVSSVWRHWVDAAVTRMECLYLTESTSQEGECLLRCSRRATGGRLHLRRLEVDTRFATSAESLLSLALALITGSRASLRSLWLEHWRAFSAHHHKALLRLLIAECPSLEYLQCRWGPCLNRQSTAALLESHPGLRTLVVPGVHPGALSERLSRGAAAALETLCLSDRHLGGTPAAVCRALRHLPVSLTDLRLSLSSRFAASRSDQVALLRSLAEFRGRLRRLTIGFCVFIDCPRDGAAGASYPLQLQLTHLETLKLHVLRSDEIDDDAGAYLACRPLDEVLPVFQAPHLRELTVRHLRLPFQEVLWRFPALREYTYDHGNCQYTSPCWGDLSPAPLPLPPGAPETPLAQLTVTGVAPWFELLHTQHFRGLERLRVTGPLPNTQNTIFQLLVNLPHLESLQVNDDLFCPTLDEDDAAPAEPLVVTLPSSSSSSSRSAENATATLGGCHPLRSLRVSLLSSPADSNHMGHLLGPRARRDGPQYLRELRLEYIPAEEDGDLAPLLTACRHTLQTLVVVGSDLVCRGTLPRMPALQEWSFRHCPGLAEGPQRMPD